MPDPMKGYSINLGLPQIPTTNNQELLSELIRVYNAIRNVMEAVDIYTGIISEPRSVWNQLGTNRCTAGLNSKIYLQAAEAIGFGQTVGIDTNGNAVLAEHAAYTCIGWCTVATGVGIGDWLEVQQFGIYPPYPAASLVPGDRYYQSTTPGVIGVSGSGTQCIGYAISDTILYFNPQLQF